MSERKPSGRFVVAFDRVWSVFWGGVAVVLGLMLLVGFVLGTLVFLYRLLVDG